MTCSAPAAAPACVPNGNGLADLYESTFWRECLPLRSARTASDCGGGARCRVASMVIGCPLERLSAVSAVSALDSYAPKATRTRLTRGSAVPAGHRLAAPRPQLTECHRLTEWELRWWHRVLPPRLSGPHRLSRPHRHSLRRSLLSRIPRPFSRALSRQRRPLSTTCRRLSRMPLSRSRSRGRHPIRWRAFRPTGSPRPRPLTSRRRPRGIPRPPRPPPAGRRPCCRPSRRIPGAAIAHAGSA